MEILLSPTPQDAHLCLGTVESLQSTSRFHITIFIETTRPLESDGFPPSGHTLAKTGNIPLHDWIQAHQSRARI